MSENALSSIIPANNSQYFSAASNLDTLDGKDEVYYSMEDGIDLEIATENLSHIRKYECHKIIIENHSESINGRLSNSLETMPRIFIHESSVDVEDWDKVCDSLNSFISQESVSTDDEYDGNVEECNNISTDRISSECNAHATVSLNNSIIEGELSDLMDIVYESFDSPDFYVNDNDQSSKLEEDNDSELGEQIDERVIGILVMSNVTEIPDLIKEPELLPISCNEDLGELKETEDGKREIETIEDSPVKKSSLLCCSIKRKKIKRQSSTSNSHMSKTKRLLSHFLFFRTKPVEKIVSKTNVSTQNDIVSVVPLEVDNFDDIPFIDEDEDSSCDAGIPLATIEVFC